MPEAAVFVIVALGFVGLDLALERRAVARRRDARLRNHQAHVAGWESQRGRIMLNDHGRAVVIALVAALAGTIIGAVLVAVIRS